jgi:hypothetical protein
MSWASVLVDRIRALIHRDAVLQDIDEELRSHVEMEADANRELGMPAEDAYRMRPRCSPTAAVLIPRTTTSTTIAAL